MLITFKDLNYSILGLSWLCYRLTLHLPATTFLTDTPSCPIQPLDYCLEKYQKMDQVLGFLPLNETSGSQLWTGPLSLSPFLAIILTFQVRWINLFNKSELQHPLTNTLPQAWNTEKHDHPNNHRKKEASSTTYQSKHIAQHKEQQCSLWRAQIWLKMNQKSL